MDEAIKGRVTVRVTTNERVTAVNEAFYFLRHKCLRVTPRDGVSNLHDNFRGYARGTPTLKSHPDIAGFLMRQRGFDGNV